MEKAMKTKWILILAFCLTSCPPLLRGESPSLESILAPLAKAHQGKVAIAVKNLDSGESYTLNADEPMSTASLIKFPVMVEAYYQYEEGKARPNDLITLNQADKVPGSGI